MRNMFLEEELHVHNARTNFMMINRIDGNPLVSMNGLSGIVEEEGIISYYFT